MLPDVYCEGTPYQIGYAHGEKARQQVLGSIAFYKGRFQRDAHLDWPAVRNVATDDFEPVIRAKWPAYLEEMQGVAEGAGVELADIVALNVRTEIAFGMFSDACTTLSWQGPGFSYLAQNWDWDPLQKPNLIRLTIRLSSPSPSPSSSSTSPSLSSTSTRPAIRMVTEAGIIGKIGLNSRGVGVCFNAIRAPGVDPTRLPAHLGLRLALESVSCAEAVAALERHGVAASCFMLVADAAVGERGQVGLEWSAGGVRKMGPDARGRVRRTNHYVVEQPEGVVDLRWLRDSPERLERIGVLCDELEERVKGRRLEAEDVRGLFRDEEGAPKSISRTAVEEHDSETLFNIVMDLKNVKAYVTVGRPSERPEESFTFEF